MSNPDTSTTTNATMNSSGMVSFNALSVAVPAACIMFIATLFLFYFKPSIPNFTAVMWVGSTIFGFFLATTMNLVSQYMYCKDTNGGKAIQGAIPSIIAILVGLGTASISFCRIPVASVFAPFFVKSTTANSDEKCCNATPSLENIEESAPMVSGLSYGFYLFFSMLFGIVLGNGVAVVCGN